MSLTFSKARDLVIGGTPMARKGWNGKGMFIFLVPGKLVPNEELALGVFPAGADTIQLPYLALKTATGEIVPWLASQTDMLADDWETYSGE